MTPKRVSLRDKAKLTDVLLDHSTQLEELYLILSEKCRSLETLLAAHHGSDKVSMEQTRALRDVWADVERRGGLMAVKVTWRECGTTRERTFRDADRVRMEPDGGGYELSNQQRVVALIPNYDVESVEILPD